MSVKITDDMNETEIQLAKRLIAFNKISNFAIFSLLVFLYLTRLITSILALFALLILSLIVLFFVFYLLFTNDNIFEKLLIKIGR